MPLTAEEVIARLELSPHPEGGHFRETWRAPAAEGERPSGTAIYFLLRDGERSAWHRVDATEIWHFHAGAPLLLRVAEGGSEVRHTLGADLAAGQAPQVIVPADAWQSAESLGPWTLVSCTVSPGFLFSGFELAPPGWSPGAPNKL
ncbi:cupin domain-containing protein [Rhodoligotrophos defluvii]|uniref:cupin domain-containing protein n=1 Tax=Rhodoligotrophos defluvii TaxID=2561934 RepID=UPI0010CA14A0|nr:cupin domain-containing protein [Rhodoligotrophos defluvii]